MNRSTSRLSAALGHPIFLGALLLLILNDHLFKALWYGSFWTGKLSDVAWLVVAPVVLGVVLGWLRVPAARWVALATTAAVFTTLQLWPPLGDAWVAWMGGAHVADAADLVTLPALGLAYLCWSTAAPEMRLWGRRLIGGVSLVALVATSQWAPPPDGRSPCAAEEAWDPARPLAIQWSSTDYEVPDSTKLLAEGVGLWDAQGRPVPFTLRFYSGQALLLICPTQALEPDSTYSWKVGGWPDLGAHSRGVPYFEKTGRWRFTTASESTWTEGCTASSDMAYVESEYCVYDTGLNLDTGGY